MHMGTCKCCKVVEGNHWMVFIYQRNRICIENFPMCPCKSGKPLTFIADYLSIYIPWPLPPVWGVVDNTEETTKQQGFHSVLLAMTKDPAEFGWHCWSNTAHPPPSSTTYVASYMPSPLLPLPLGCLFFRAVSEEFYTRGGDSQSPRSVPFSCLLRHAENTLVLFFCLCPTPQGTYSNKEEKHPIVAWSRNFWQLPMTFNLSTVWASTCALQSK